MIKIKIFSSFCDSFGCKLAYERLCETKTLPFYGVDKDIYITNDEDYTHVIIMNTAMPNLKNIPKKNIIGIAVEPPQFLGLTAQFVLYAQKYINKYFIGEKGNLPLPFIEHFGYMYHVTPLTYLPIKNKCMSIMISQKQYAEGHIYRHTLVKSILKSNLPIDIYGRGCHLYTSLNDSRVKGSFTESEQYDLYENYDFHICIENFMLNHYFSEKIINPLLCSTTPIYLGCKNIKDYFSDNVIFLSGNVEKDMFLLTNIIKNPEQYKKNIKLDEIKNKISLIKNVKNLF
jgi:hypothetical protein